MDLQNEQRWKREARVFNSGAVHTNLKTHQMLSESVYTTLEKFENTTISVHFGFVFEENSLGEKKIAYLNVIVSKTSVFKMFSIYTKTRSRCFQIRPVWTTFSKSFVFVTDTCER